MVEQSDGQGSSPAASDLVGKVLGRYRILSPLGVGGMGTVYLAEHMTLGRRTAVKVLNPAMARDPDALARFRREARNASTIEHPNVCAVYDFGDTPEGLTFLAMELIDGKPLSLILEESGGRIPLERASRILSSVAQGLDAAHARGIVHRDLKPANIMITAAPGDGDGVKVVDFGIAKAAAGGEGQEVTRVGLVAGTPQYMSPEHISGDEPDPRSDVYSLGVVFFRAVTGQLPFQAESQAELLRKILTEPPQRLHDACPELPVSDGLERVMDRALSRDRTRRQASAGELAREIESALAGAPAHVPDPAGAASDGRSGTVGGTPREGRPLPEGPHGTPGVSGRPVEGPSTEAPETAVTGSLRIFPWLVGSGIGAAVLALIAVWVFGFGGHGGVGAPAFVSVTPNTFELAPGGTAQLSATVTDANDQAVEGVAPVWISEDLQIAAVGPGGLVTGIGSGTTRISAKIGEVVGTAFVSVTAPGPSSIEVTPASVRLTAGATTTLRASVSDSEGNPDPSAQVTWSSDQPQVATVDASGTVTGRAEGTAVIQANAGGNVAGTAHVRVVMGARPEELPSVDPGDAQAVLTGMLALGDSTPRPTLTQARRQAEAFWALGDSLSDRYRALAAYLVGWTSTILGDRSFEDVEQWLQRAVDLDPRESYRQALAEHRRRKL